MTDIPILFIAPMVSALRAGRKTQTRRLAWKQCPPPKGDSVPNSWRWTNSVDVMERPTIWQKVRPGDRLWVRESWRTLQKLDYLAPRHLADDRSKITYEADPENRNPLWAFGKLRRSIHMPRWASRLTLVVIETKIERLQEISIDDAWEEGVERRSKKVRQMWLYGATQGQRSDIYRRAAKWEFQDLWDELHGAGAWNDNPEVVALAFRIHPCNIDQLGAQW